MSASGRLLALLVTWGALGLAPSLIPALLPLWALAGGALLLLVAVDLGAHWGGAPQLEAERTLAHVSLAAGSPNEVRVRLRNSGRRALRVEVFDHHPASCSTPDLPQAGVVPAEGFWEFGYALRPHERGTADFGRIELRVAGRLGLTWRRVWRGASQPVRVYPNFQEVVRFALLTLAGQLDYMGIRKARRRGQGQDFHQLRGFREGDLLRQIDWKATARRRRLISREYQEERDQRVVFLLDCGRRLRARDGEVEHFEQVLNAVLLLTYVSVRQGDAVGLQTFSGEERWLPPRKGQAGLRAILEGCYDLQTTTAPSDFSQAALQLGARLRKRSLVVLITNLRDEDQDELRPALVSLRKRHLVLLASLREQALDQTLAEEVGGLRSAIRAAAVLRHLHERREVLQQTQLGGVMVMDVLPADLPTRLVNRYLEVKRSGRL